MIVLMPAIFADLRELQYWSVCVRSIDYVRSARDARRTLCSGSFVVVPVAELARGWNWSLAGHS
jgi:hypothetical protein